jgi:hypothetical protein
MTPAQFIERWKDSGGAELANSQSFLKELCDLLDVPHPEPTVADETLNGYVFEKAVEFNNGDGTVSQGRIDLYRQSCFVLESKQGVERKEAEQAQALATRTRTKKLRSGTAQRGTPGWEQAMTKARHQAKRYAEALPNEWPPFLVVVDVGHCFDLYADFAQSGKNYIPFPDPQSYRIHLSDLEEEAVRQRLRALWLDPHSLDSSRIAAKVTRELADRLARLAKSLEGKHEPHDVARFLMRCLFTMFAEDVGLISNGSFTELLRSLTGNVSTFVPMVESLWQTMDTGGFSPILREHVKQFNGGLFEEHSALPLNADQLELLIEAAEAKWNDVEPAIFGTLLERALDPVERHKLGAHYTPRAYVERLVMPTIMEPLRAEWDTVYATAVAQYEGGHKADARKTVRRFHEQLCETRILDPACGSGNFLYVSLELMKRLEGEVLKTLRSFGDRQKVLLTVDPHQFLGIEVNPRAAAITDLVLWIGYLQWHFRTRGSDPLNEPIIRKFHNIECRDAVLAWDAIEPVTDEQGNPVTRWDGRTTKPHPVTGEEVPDETARVQELRYVNPRKAEWPKADYVVGNPPFVGKLYMLNALGEGYVSALRSAYPGIPDGCDYVMYWWHKASECLGTETCRYGFISTKSISQWFNRRVVTSAIEANANLNICFAIPNHPWVDAADGADVRIAMTVCELTESDGLLAHVISEKPSDDGSVSVDFGFATGRIGADLRIGADVLSTSALNSNLRISGTGACLGGRGFVLSREEVDRLIQKNPECEKLIFKLRHGRDLTDVPRGVFVIDASGWDDSVLRQQVPEIYQHLHNTVFPQRAENRDPRLRRQWWLYRRSNEQVRRAISDLVRYLATSETSRHRTFQFLDGDVIAEHKLVVIGSDDAYLLGVLSSRPHVTWALAAGGRLGVGNDPVYSKSTCFEKFPFPDTEETTKQRIRDLGEQLDAHRKRQQELHPALTMTGMYNVLEKLRSGEELTAREKTIHEQGLVSVLKQIHDDLDAAVFDAYGWPHDLSDEEILQRLVELNHQRAEEESRGIVRWLRPEFQNPAGDQKRQQTLTADEEESEAKPKKAKAKATAPKKQPWPKSLPDRISAVRHVLAEHPQPATPAEIAKYFTRGKATQVEELLETLVLVGQARLTDDGRYAA